MALVFVASGLIPNNHPATRYGIEGVKKYSFFELVGEAWFTLRTTNASVHQWGLFAAIILMLSTITIGIGSFIARLFFNLGAVAHAQIFNYPDSLEPYNGTQETGLDSVDAIPDAGGVLYDMRVGPPIGAADGASQDYALMVLDKVLRQAAVGNGGAMQNALAGLMEVYNTGVMVVAAVMIFWMILSIVVDTAKTGIVGGGRHNMVWTPIRVVFALGIMIPLGSTGFSSGQFMVMKLAEWGSNFGTRGWVTYVDNVIASTEILAPYSAKNVSHIVSGIAKVLVCQISYNTSVHQTTGWLQSDEGSNIGVRAVWDQASRSTTNYYSNSSTQNLCGGIRFAGIGHLLNPQPTDVVAEYMADDTAGGGVAAATNASDLVTAMNAYRSTMAEAVRVLVDDGDLSGAPGSAFPGEMDSNTGGDVIRKLRSLACDVVRTAFSDGGGGGQPTNQTHPCDDGAFAAGVCNIDPDTGFPDHTCVQEAAQMLSEALNNAETDTARANLNTWVNTHLKPMMARHGWAGMGTWFMHLNSLNQMIASAESAAVSVEAGELWRNERSGSWLGNGIRTWATVQTLGAFNFNTVPQVNAKTFEAMRSFDKWWQTMTARAPAGSYTDAAQELQPKIADDADGWFSTLKEMGTGGLSAVGAFFDKIIPFSTDTLLPEVIDPTETNTYPLAQLVKVGALIQWWGLGLMIANSVIAWVVGYFTGGSYSTSTLGTLIGMMAKGMFMGGVMIGVYLPILPLIRVAFAVLTWIISVFEAVVMVPIAALGHLSSEGEGIAGSSGARNAWILWLNVLMRPMLVVLGFVGAMLIFNAFALYFHVAFANGIELARNSLGGLGWITSVFTYSVVYVMTLYTACNTTFKLLDVIPDAMMRWMGGSPDKSFDDGSDFGSHAAAKMLTESQGSGGLWGGAGRSVEARTEAGKRREKFMNRFRGKGGAKGK